MEQTFLERYMENFDNVRNTKPIETLLVQCIDLANNIHEFPNQVCCTYCMDTWQIVCMHAQKFSNAFVEYIWAILQLTSDF